MAVARSIVFTLLAVTSVARSMAEAQTDRPRPDARRRRPGGARFTTIA